MQNIFKKINFNRWFGNKRFSLFFSVAAAFIFWLVIMISQNPVRTQTFSDIPVSVSIDNTVASEMGLGIVSDISSQKFTVTLSGPNYIVSSLKAEDFMLSASVTDVNAAGTYSLDVLGTRNSAKSGYTFVSITPSQIEVTFDYVDTKEFTITPKLVGVGAVEGLIAETPAISGTEDTITIKGPRAIMDKIDSVVAYAEINKTLSSSQTYTADIQVLDASGNKIDTTYLTLNYTTVKVSVPISKKASVRVKPAFTNVPSGVSTDALNWSVNHSTVTIIGPPEVVSSMQEITLSPIDFNSISSASTSFDVSVTLPEGVRLLDNIEFFTVSVNTSGFAERTFTVTAVRYTGLDSSLTAKISRSIRNVKVCGPADVISKLKSTDLYAVLDLTGRTAGEYTVDVKIKSEVYNNIWQVGTYSAAVTIK